MLLLLRFSFSSLTATKQRKIKTSASSTTVPVGAVGGNLYTIEDDMAANDRNRRYSANVCNPMLEGKSFETKSQDKSKRPNSRRRQSTMVVLAQKRKNTIDSIEAVSNIVNMILVPMVIVPFLDYQTLGKIPRSNTAKPGSGDGATAKMGSPNSISQPHGEGWTVVFVSVSNDWVILPTPSPPPSLPPNRLNKWTQWHTSTRSRTTCHSRCFLRIRALSSILVLSTVGGAVITQTMRCAI